MIFSRTKLGAYIIELEKREDERGFLARTWDKEQFKDIGIDFDPVEGYITMSKHKGTVRGLHYLTVPEKKLTRVLRGGVFEVIIDLRSESPTYKQWEGFTFKDSDYKMLYMTAGFAHAILTLEPTTELMSWYSPAYKPGLERGIRYNDPTFYIKWPIPVQHVSKKDLSWEDFKDQLAGPVTSFPPISTRSSLSRSAGSNELRAVGIPFTRATRLQRRKKA